MEVYLDQHPHLAEDEDAVVELLYAEYVVREELGESPTAEEWYRGFPVGGTGSAGSWSSTGSLRTRKVSNLVRLRRGEPGAGESKGEVRPSPQVTCFLARLIGTERGDWSRWDGGRLQGPGSRPWTGPWR